MDSITRFVYSLFLTCRDIIQPSSALRLFFYGVLIVCRKYISKDMTRINTLCPGILGGDNNRFGGFATTLGAVVFFQDLLLYLTKYQKPPRGLPDIWPVIISALGSIIFCLFYFRRGFIFFITSNFCTYLPNMINP